LEDRQYNYKGSKKQVKTMADMAIRYLDHLNGLHGNTRTAAHARNAKYLDGKKTVLGSNDKTTTLKVRKINRNS